MSTITLQIEAMVSERFGSRSLAAPFRAGLASQNSALLNYSLDAAQEIAIPSPSDATQQTVLVACDSYVSIILGWTLNDGSVHEVPVLQLALVTIPANAQAYVRNAASDGLGVPVRVLTTY